MLEIAYLDVLNRGGLINFLYIEYKIASANLSKISTSEISVHLHKMLQASGQPVSFALHIFLLQAHVLAWFCKYRQYSNTLSSRN